ncbi:MAG TPA: hypothetical protein VF785_13985 [Gemmatimonadaceae bacterium]
MAPDLVPLAGWDSFYVIVGSSSAALTGLNFVVIALGAESRTLSGTADLSAFGTPTIMHFCAALLVSAILSAPWHTASSLAACIGACGVAGLMYVGRVMLIARRGTTYKPVFEDVLWHFALPLIAYALILVASAIFVGRIDAALFTIAFAVLLLMFIGIHNAWDTATYMAFAARRAGTAHADDAENVSSPDTSNSRTG